MESRTRQADAGLSGLRARAFVDPLGKAAWPREDAAAAARLLADEGLAIVRAELWCLCWDETYCNVVPFTEGRAGLRQWILEQHWDAGGETWAEFCRRSAREVLPFLETVRCDAMLTREYGPDKMRLHFQTLIISDYDADDI